MRLSELKQILSNEPFEIVEDGEFNALGMATSTFESETKVLSFLANKKFTNDVLSNQAISAIILSPETSDVIGDNWQLGIIKSDNPKKLFYLIHNYLADVEFYWKKWSNQIDPSAIISPNAILPDHSLTIGKGSVVEANVVINPGVIMGDHVIIRSGTQIGSNGFQYLQDEGQMISVKSAGTVVIGNDVEIQHLTCIDRGVFGGATILRDYSKVDNLVHIAHDVDIGERTLVVAGSSIGGRTVIGHDSWIGINATVSNGLVIGDHSNVSLGAVVTRNVGDHERVTGNFAIDHAKFMKNLKEIR